MSKIFSFRPRSTQHGNGYRCRLRRCPTSVIPRFRRAGGWQLKVNCPEGAREATLGCLPEGQCHKLKDSISKYQKGTAIIVQNTTWQMWNRPKIKMYSCFWGETDEILRYLSWNCSLYPLHYLQWLLHSQSHKTTDGFYEESQDELYWLYFRNY